MSNCKREKEDSLLDLGWWRDRVLAKLEMEGDSRGLNQSASGDIAGSHGSEKEEQSISKSEVATSAPRGAKDGGSIRQKTGRHFTDLSYLDNLSRHERQRIEAEISDGHKPGECTLCT